MSTHSNTITVPWTTITKGVFDWALPEEAPCACPSSDFYSFVAIVGRANSTDSASSWKSTPLFQQLPALLCWKKLEEGRALPDSSGRGWKSPIKRALSEAFMSTHSNTITKFVEHTITK